MHRTPRLVQCHWLVVTILTVCTGCKVDLVLLSPPAETLTITVETPTAIQGKAGVDPATPTHTATPLPVPAARATPAHTAVPRPTATPTTSPATAPTITPSATPTLLPAYSCPSSGAEPDAAWIAQLLDYAEGRGLPPRAVQVDLAVHRKVSQYEPQIVAEYGFNACGPVAAAAALWPENWIAAVGQIVTAGGDAYGPRTGIQPSPFAAALARVSSVAKVNEENDWSLCAMLDALNRGAVVIVDTQVGSHQNARPEQPTTEPPDYAHFARVLGIDLVRGEVYVENTLRGEAAYWTLSLSAFWRVWQYPETEVSIRAPIPEEVNQWAVVIDTPK